ncbi:MAG: aldolase/citrate lyase family protein [Solirubrobacteraceae bacterium]
MTAVVDRSSLPLRRSCLAVPGHAVRMHEKAVAIPADEVVFDLEDAVARTAKQDAREAIAATLAQGQWKQRTVAVRINPPASPEHAADLELVGSLQSLELLTVVVPKVSTPETLFGVSAALDEEIGLQALIETPAGIEAVEEIAMSTQRLRALILGYADLATALGRRGAERHVERWLYYQEVVLAAARSAGLHAIDGPVLRLGEPLSLARVARAARELGFDGKWAIHPDQVEPLNRAFAASERESHWARAVIEALAGDSLAGGGAVCVDGAMVDEAMRAQAKRLVALPRRAEAAHRELNGRPYFEDVAVGDVFHAPGLTLTAAHGALHQAVVGDRLRLSLDAPLCEEVTGVRAPLAHPMLVCDVAIGQSTEPSGRVLGNLFYRGLAARPPARRDDPGDAGDDVQAAADRAAQRDVHDLVPTDWRLDALRRQPLGVLFADLRAGQSWALGAGETVTCAPELARLSLNVAMTHTDATAGMHGQRLVYGGHVTGVGASHLTRVLPDLATILALRSCDHLGPTFEGDVLRSEIKVEEPEPLSDGGLVHARVLVSAQAVQDDEPRRVLDWRLTALMP